MNKDYIIDYSSYIGFKILIFITRVIPKGLSLFLGRRLGDLLYYFNLELKARSYANIKSALGENLTPAQLTKITRTFFRSFGQNLIEVFFVPLINKEYISKYISISGLENIFTAFKKGKGVILLGVHEGSWELSSVIVANLGFTHSLLVRAQSKFARIEGLLNLYRRKKGCKIIQRRHQTRQLVESLKNNECIGMTLDQGGKTGALVKFFGKEASMATGAVRLALKYGVPILPGFCVRLRGPYTKIIIGQPFEIRKTGDTKQDLNDNLQRLTLIFEKYIKMYPQEYLWSYKIWKYGRERNILILSDGKTGHLRQSQAVAGIINGYLTQNGFQSKTETIEIKLKYRLSKLALLFCGCLCAKYRCQGCLSCLKRLLEAQNYNHLISKVPDTIISCGSKTAVINFLIARENLARSIVVLKPPALSTRKFDLVIMPRHDNPHRRKNIAVIEAALNLINDEYLKQESQKLLSSSYVKGKTSPTCIGLLIGGDTKSFHLEAEIIQEVVRHIKAACERLNTDILVTTSRRTSEAIENLIKEEFKNYSRCRLLIIANEKNIPEAVGGILGLSDIVVISPESVSMISEAVSSKKYVLVFNSQGLSRKHKNFLDYFSKNKYIYLTDTSDLGAKIEEILLVKPKISLPRDNLIVSEAIKRIL
jgi:KDO2-lipid IV(A) lauroyltransferase